MADMIDYKGKKNFSFLVPFTKEENKDYTFTRNADQFYKDFLAHYAESKDDVKGTILINYRNAVTQKLAKDLRTKALGASNKRFIVGERIVCKRGTKDIEGTDAAMLTTHKMLIVTAVKEYEASVKISKVHSELPSFLS